MDLSVLYALTSILSDIEYFCEEECRHSKACTECTLDRAKNDIKKLINRGNSIDKPWH